METLDNASFCGREEKDEISQFHFWMDKKNSPTYSVTYKNFMESSCTSASGWAYLAKLEAMLRTGSDCPVMLYSEPKGLQEDLRWWTDILQQPLIFWSIPQPISLHNARAFSDVSLGIGIAHYTKYLWYLIPPPSCSPPAFPPHYLILPHPAITQLISHPHHSCFNTTYWLPFLPLLLGTTEQPITLSHSWLSLLDYSHSYSNLTFQSYLGSGF